MAGILAAGLAFIAAFWIARLALAQGGVWLHQIRSRETHRVREIAGDVLARDLPVASIVLVRLAGAPILGLIFWSISGLLVIGLIVGVVTYMAPIRYLQIVLARRRQLLEQQVGDLIASIAATSKSGMTLLQSIEEVGRRMPPPMSEEFLLVLERIRSGQTVEAALLACDARARLPALTLVLRAVLVSEQRGGKLVEVLERLGRSMREIQKVEERVRTETSGIKLSSRIMAGMPVVIVGLLYLMAPDQVALLFTTIAGNVILVVALGLDWLGFTMIRKLSEIEV